MLLCVRYVVEHEIHAHIHPHTNETHEQHVWFFFVIVCARMCMLIWIVDSPLDCTSYVCPIWTTYDVRASQYSNRGLAHRPRVLVWNVCAWVRNLWMHPYNSPTHLINVFSTTGPENTNVSVRCVLFDWSWNEPSCLPHFLLSIYVGLSVRNPKPTPTPTHRITVYLFIVDCNMYAIVDVCKVSR